MAKSRGKGRTSKRTRKSTSRQRTSTRRVSSGRTAGARAAPARVRARAATGAETLQLTLDLRDVLGQPIQDPETFFTFRRVTGNRQVGDQLAMQLAGAAPVFALPVFTSEALVCEIDPRRFRFVHSPVFLGSPGPPIRRECRLLREPGEWTARFTPWQQLPAAFDGLKDVLRVSPQITLFKDVEPIADLFIEDAYDNAGERVTHAKTALLNSYFMLSRTREPLSDDRSWFSFVRRIIAIGRERFLAFVDPEMEVLVRQIHGHSEEFRADYERTPAENHRGNVPASMQGRIASMISIKSTHRKGNFQLTLTRLTSPDEVLLDTDIDENGDLFGHFLDLLKHKFTDGTHPYEIHELLALMAGGEAGFDLGYRLA